MNSRLVPNSVTLNDLERRNSHNGCVFTEFGRFLGNYVNVVEDTLVLTAAEM